MINETKNVLTKIIKNILLLNKSFNSKNYFKGEKSTREKKKKNYYKIPLEIKI